MSRYIDADAYAAEMKTRQDALKELMDDADALDNWEMYYGLSRAFSVFVEAKLTLDTMPTVDAVQVVRCRDCKYYGEEYGSCGRTDIIRSDMRIIMPYWYCADGERKGDENN